jgi:hypothetical protein
MRYLYEILVPRVWSHGTEISVEFHRLWDEKVRAVSGGLTILHPVKGQWVYQGKLIDEGVIPCRVIATREEIEQILAITLEHYHDQISVLAYKLSDEIILKYRREPEHGCS